MTTLVKMAAEHQGNLEYNLSLVCDVIYGTIVYTTFKMTIRVNLTGCACRRGGGGW